MSDLKSGYFCVYSSTPIEDDVLVQTLNRGQFDNLPSETQWSTPQTPFPPQSPSAIINRHRQSPGTLDKQYLVIGDRSDWATSSILAVNLDFDGWEDAVRMEVAVAGDAIPSVSIANTDWVENLGAVADLWPKERFAVYVTARDLPHREHLVNELNAGLEGRKAWTMGGAVCKDATPLLPEDRKMDVAAVASLHESIAVSEGFDPATFIVVDKADWESDGVQVVRMDGPDVDVCSKPAETAGEILTWVHQGLYTWAEGKEWKK